MRRASKKQNRRMKRTVRRTIGALCLISAITIAAIPVPENMAYDPATADVPKYPKLEYDSSGNPIRNNNGSAGYLKIDDTNVPGSDTSYTKNNTAFVISKTSTLLAIS